MIGSRKDTQVFHARNRLLDSHHRYQHAGARRAKPAVTLVGHNAQTACFRDRKVHARNPHVGVLELLSQHAPCRCGQYFRVVAVFNAEFLRKQSADIPSCLMDRRRDDVTRPVAGKLKDVFSQVGFDDLKARRLENVVQADLLADHGLALGNQLDVALARNVADDLAGLKAGSGEVDVSAALLHVINQLFEVAVKVLPEYYMRDARFLARFQREAQAIAQLGHPNILPVYDFGREGNLTFIVMQYVDGGTLKKLMGDELSYERIGDLLGQVADALDYAHGQGILHRDVKPSNILIERVQRALLSDFGLAKMVGSQEQITATGVGLGTPAYMSPEQGQGEEVDARTDVYALGVILYEMITGRVPFRAETPMAIIIKHVTTPLPLPRSINPTIPDSVEQVILKALAKNKEDRYASAGAMMTAFNKALAGAPGPLTAPPPEAASGPVCPVCGHANRPDVRFCEECAAPLGDQGSTCPSCGYTNRPGVRFCEECATSL